MTAIHGPGTTYESARGGRPVRDPRHARRRAVPRHRRPGRRRAGFEPQTQENVTVNLGVATDLEFKSARRFTDQVTVTAQPDPVFSSERTGAATTVSRETLATLPTISGRIEDSRA